MNQRTDPARPTQWAWSNHDTPADTVAGLAGDVWDSYVRVLHPAFASQDTSVEPVSWRTIAQKNDRPFYDPSASFHETSGVFLHSGEHSSGWDIEPHVGGADYGTGLRLANALAAITNDPMTIHMGVWYGYSEVQDHEGMPERFGSRSYYTFTYPIHHIVEVPNTWRPANVYWPNDHSWIAVADVDLPCTYIGTDPDRAQHLLSGGLFNDHGLEITPVQRTSRVGEPLD